jgi:hypothetical protein
VAKVLVCNRKEKEYKTVENGDCALGNGMKLAKK